MNSPGSPNASVLRTPDTFNELNRTNRSSPSAVVMENSQYRRPASILPNSSSTAGGNRPTGSQKPLPRNVMGSILLSLHFFISLLMILCNLVVIFIEFGIFWLKQQISSVPEIPEPVIFIFAILSLIGLIVSFKVPAWLLFGSSKTFRTYCFRDNFYFKYASFTVLGVGIINISIHFWLFFKPSSISQITPFLPAGAFLIINALLNLKLHRELCDGGAVEQAIMLPYTPEKKDTDDWMVEEMSDITGSDRV